MNAADFAALLDCPRAESVESGCRKNAAVLQSLVRDGMLTQQNQRRWASYRIADDSPQSSPQLDRLAGLSPDARALLPLAEPARQNKKLPVDCLKAVILQLCLDRWMSTSELAALVDRDAEKLQSRFLTAMVRAGALELRYPAVRNRPDQAYRTVGQMGESTGEKAV